MAITINSTDEELMQAFESLRRQACGELLGRVTDTPEDAVSRNNGWTVERIIHGGTNRPGTPVLAKDVSDGLWVIDDLDGPWGIMVAAQEVR